MIPLASNVPEIDVTVEASSFLPVTPLDVPILTSPDEQYSFIIPLFNPTPTVTFVWGAVSGATDYEIEVSDDSAFESILKVVKASGGVATIDYAPIIIDPATHLPTSDDIAFDISQRYYWRVRATAGVVSSPWSKVWEFGFQRQTLQQITLGNEFTQEGEVGDPLPTAAELAAAAAEEKAQKVYYDPVDKGIKAVDGTDVRGWISVLESALFKIWYDPTAKALKVDTTGSGAERYPTVPQVAGDLPGAANGDVWFDTTA